MRFSLSLILLTALSTLSVSAVPVPAAATASKKPAISITAAQILKIAPDAKSCQGASVPKECRTAAQAAPLLNAAHAKFGITTRGEMAALVSLQLFESAHFKFQTNQAKNPGQGTRNMMNIPFIYAYALDTPPKKSAALKLIPKSKDVNSASAATKNQVRALVLEDDLDFASAAWFLTRSKQTTGQACDQSIRDGLKSESQKGWENFITKCVGTTVTDERKKLWQAALAAIPKGK